MMRTVTKRCLNCRIEFSRRTYAERDPLFCSTKCSARARGPRTICKQGHLLSETRILIAGKWSRCGACRKKHDFDYSKEVGVSERRASNARLRQYGMTDDEFQSLLRAQNNACAICQIPFNNGDYRRDWPQVDHDHLTGLVRGLLCHKCNTGIGMFKHNPEILETARSYILALWKKVMDDFFDNLETQLSKPAES